MTGAPQRRCASAPILSSTVGLRRKVQPAGLLNTRTSRAVNRVDFQAAESAGEHARCGQSRRPANVFAVLQIVGRRATQVFSRKQTSCNSTMLTVDRIAAAYAAVQRYLLSIQARPEREHTHGDWRLGDHGR